MHQTPFSFPAERNKQPIYEVLKTYIKNNATLLEIGSGTGQHIEYFSEKFPEVVFQPSNPDCSTLMVLDKNNILKPFRLDVNIKTHWPNTHYDYIYTANTCHIMSWEEVLLMIDLISTHLKTKGLFFCYGPFIFKDRQTKKSNINFDIFLKEKLLTMGLRHFDDIEKAALTNKLELIKIHDMPTNNNLLIFELQ